MNRQITLIGLFLLSFLSTFSASKIYVGVGGKLDTFKIGNIFPLKISSKKPIILSDTYGIEYINVKIKCVATGDLGFYLISPRNISYLLSWRNGGTGRNFDSTFFTDSSANPLFFGKAPYKGNYVGESFLKELNYGESDTGEWKLLVYDYNIGKKDLVVNWSIGFGNHPMRDVKLDSSDIPIVSINTLGNYVPYDDPMANSKLYIIDNGAGKTNYLKDSVKFNGYCGIKQHGNWSRSFPKQSYNITTMDSNYVKKNISVLGMPKESDWILLANYLDKSLLRNALAQYMFRAMGHYSPRVRHVELVMNGRYQGVYLLVEKIKIDKNRVDITKMDTTTAVSGDALTGGYLMKQDWKGSIGFTSKFGKMDDTAWHPYTRFVNPVIPAVKQFNYMQSYFDSFETYMQNGSKTARPNVLWRNYMDEKSMIDYWLMQEMSMNIDGHRASFFMYKDKNSIDKRINLGPVWDFDISFGSYWISRYGWWFNSGWGNTNFWWPKLTGNKYPIGPKTGTAWYNFGQGDSTFLNNLKCNWKIYRRTGGVLNEKKLDAWVDSNATFLKQAQGRNFKQWPVWGWQLYISAPANPKNYTQQMDSLKDWLHDRMRWMDKYMPGICRLDIDPPVVSLLGFDTVKLIVNTSYSDLGVNYTDNFGTTNVTVIKTSNLDTSKLGTYFVKYQVSDKAGNKVNKQRIILVIDPYKPVITKLRGDTLAIEVNEIYLDTNLLVKDNYDKNPKIIKGGTFNFTKNIPTSLGFYTLTYKVIDQSGNKDSAVMVLKVRDSKAPKIFFSNGLDSISAPVLKDTFITDVNILDNYDTNPTLTSSLKLNKILTNKLGYSSAWFYGRDRSGNKDSIKRVIYVYDSISPIVKLIGKPVINLWLNETYSDSGYIVSDNFELNPRVDTIGFVDVNQSGVYKIIYSSKDLSKNYSIPAIRTVNVSTITYDEGLKNQKSDLDFSMKLNAKNLNYTLNYLKSESFSISIINSLGQEMYKDINSGVLGYYQKNINLESFRQGIYLLKIESKSIVRFKKFLLE